MSEVEFCDNRGSLQVLNKWFEKIITGLLCHLSTLACPKVLEETRHLPNVLDAYMIQREAVWPESFLKFGMNNLALAFISFLRMKGNVLHKLKNMFDSINIFVLYDFLISLLRIMLITHALTRFLSCLM